MQKHLEQHHEMQSSFHHGCNKRGGSPWGLATSHRCNVLNQELEDGGGLIYSAMQNKKHLKAYESMGWLGEQIVKLPRPTLHRTSTVFHVSQKTCQRWCWKRNGRVVSLK
jgi:hypothetical protein